MESCSSLHVVIPTHERPTLLRRTLNSLAECKHPEAYQGTVVVENGSKAGAERIVKAHEDTLNAKYLYTPRGNKSHALNRVLETIEDGLVVFFDDDVRIYSNTLLAYSESAAEHNRGVFFGGPVEVDYETPPPEWLRPALPLSAKGYTVGSGGRDFYLGFNWAAFAQDIKSLEGFDPRFGPGSYTGATGQEADMQERLIEAECSSVNVPEARVAHFVPQERCNLARVLDRKYKIGIHIATKNERSIVRVIKSILSFTFYSLRKLAEWNTKNACLGLANVSYQVGQLKAEVEKRYKKTFIE